MPRSLERLWDRAKRLYRERPLLAPVTILLASLAIYVLGFRALFVPVLLGCLAWYVPLPRIFRSLVSRLVIGLFVGYGLLMVVDLVQFFVFGQSGFAVTATLLTTMVLAVIALLWGRAKPESLVWFDKKDAAALLVVACFLLPATIATGMYKGDVATIAKFGVLQSSDGANHFTILTEVSGAGHLTYRTNSYYPKGFHLNTGFVQDSLHLNQSSVSFITNARIFAGQYLVFGSLLAYMLFYLCRLVADMLSARLRGQKNIVLALTLGLPLSAFFLLTLLFQGFLSSFYVTAVIACAVLFVHEFYERRHDKDPRTKRWFLICYLLFALSISMSWTLLLPPLLIIPMLYVLPDKLTWRQVPGLLSQALARRNWLVIAAVLLQVVPIYLHFTYAVLTGEQWFNSQGSIRAFHVGVFVAGLVMVLYVSASTQIFEQLRRLTTNVFLPLLGFLAFLMIVQFFLVGEVRYYVIKTGFTVEMLLLAFAAALAVYAFAANVLGWVQAFCMPVLIVFVGLLFLISLNTNPLKDVRELLRDYSGFGKPAFFDEDIAGLVALANTGKVYSSNAIVAHYDPQSDKLLSNMTSSYWVSVMQHEPQFDMKVEICKAKLFAIAMYQEVTVEQQATFKAKILECAALAKGQHREYFIVTDGASAPYLRNLFGGAVVVVVQ